MTSLVAKTHAVGSYFWSRGGAEWSLKASFKTAAVDWYSISESAHKSRSGKQTHYLFVFFSFSNILPISMTRVQTGSISAFPNSILKSIP